MKTDVPDVELAPEACRYLDDFGVDVRSRIAEGLAIDLVKLAVASLLGPLVAEHCTRGP